MAVRRCHSLSEPEVVGEQVTPKGRDPGEIVPASDVPMSPRACPPWVGRAGRPPDARRPDLEIAALHVPACLGHLVSRGKRFARLVAT
jgi:hypothetical protein